MKRIILFGFITAMVLSFVSCKTEVKDPAGERNVAVVPALTDVDPAVYDSKNLTTTFVQFTVDVNDAAAVSGSKIVVSYNGEKQRVDFSTIQSFPSTIKVQLADVVQKLGMTLDDVKLGDVFTIEVLTTSAANGKTYRSNAAIDAPVVCAYDPNNVTGNYAVTESGDWGSSGDITITVDPNDDHVVWVSGLEEIEGLVEDKGPLKMVINPLNFEVTVDRQVLVSDLSPWDLTYTNLAYEGFGKVNTCDGSYNMTFTISVDQGTFGTYNFTLTKK